MTGMHVECAYTYRCTMSDASLNAAIAWHVSQVFEMSLENKS